jgi:hypothetical protein
MSDSVSTRRQTANDTAEPDVARGCIDGLAFRAAGR